MLPERHLDRHAVLTETATCSRPVRAGLRTATDQYDRALRRGDRADRAAARSAHGGKLAGAGPADVGHKCGRMRAERHSPDHADRVGRGSTWHSPDRVQCTHERRVRREQKAWRLRMPEWSEGMNEWGRIGEDGTVFVRTPDGEREIG